MSQLDAVLLVLLVLSLVANGLLGQRLYHKWAYKRRKQAERQRGKQAQWASQKYGSNRKRGGQNFTGPAGKGFGSRSVRGAYQAPDDPPY